MTSVDQQIHQALGGLGIQGLGDASAVGAERSAPGRRQSHAVSLLTEEDRALLPEVENEHQLTEFFRMADANADGLISGIELQLTLEKRQPGRQVSMQALKRIIAAVDADNDGHIDYVEACKLFNILSVQRPASIASRAPQQQAVDISLAQRAKAALTPLSEQRQLLSKFVERYPDVAMDDYPAELVELLRKLLTMIQFLHVQVCEASEDRAGVSARMRVLADMKSGQKALSAALTHLGTLIARTLDLRALRCAPKCVEELTTSALNLTASLKRFASLDLRTVIGKPEEDKIAMSDPFAEVFGDAPVGICRSPRQLTRDPGPPASGGSPAEALRELKFEASEDQAPAPPPAAAAPAAEASQAAEIPAEAPANVPAQHSAEVPVATAVAVPVAVAVSALAQEAAEVPLATAVAVPVAVPMSAPAQEAAEVPVATAVAAPAGVPVSTPAQEAAEVPVATAVAAPVDVPVSVLAQEAAEVPVAAAVAVPVSVPAQEAAEVPVVAAVAVPVAVPAQEAAEMPVAAAVAAPVAVPVAVPAPEAGSAPAAVATVDVVPAAAVAAPAAAATAAAEVVSIPTPESAPPKAEPDDPFSGMLGSPAGSGASQLATEAPHAGDYDPFAPSTPAAPAPKPTNLLADFDPLAM